ncbi:MAG: ATP12 family protein [Pseudomonadota bacterium]
MKRFWKDVAVVRDGDAFGITLDARPVRTPGRTALAVASPMLADAIADEWRAVEAEIDPRTMPLTGLTNAAIDRIGPDRLPFAQGLARYAESDLLCYRAELPEPLVLRQRAAWDPLLDWARTRYDVHFETTVGVMPTPQPRATLARLGDAVAARSAFELAGLSPVVTVTGSLVLALALIEGAADADAIWHAARIDDDWQVEMWGEDHLAAQTTAAHRADFDAGVRFLSLL